MSSVSDNGLLRFSINGKTRYVQSSLTDQSSPIGMNISESKSITADLATSIGLKLPISMRYSTLDSSIDFLNAHKMIVVKPNDGAHGNGVTVGVTTQAELNDAVEIALKFSKSGTVILQQQVTGQDVRVLIIDGKLAASSIRTPAEVTGDGQHTIAQLIAIENDSELRGQNYHTSLNEIDSETANMFLGTAALSSIPAKDETMQVAGTANIGTGGTATDITDHLPESIIMQSKDLAEELSLQCAGVDFIADDLADPSSYYFIEVNASPSFGLHMKPTHGSPREVQKIFVDMLLRDSAKNP